MKLKPCPFCGGEAETIYSYFRPYIICRKCHAQIPCYNTYPMAAEAWNTREPIDKIVEQLRECRDKCAFDAEVHAYQTAVRIVKGGAE